MTALDNHARALLRRLGSWPVADLLLDPGTGAAHLRTSCWGGTYTDGQHFQCGPKGIEVYDLDGDTLDRRTVLLVRWGQVAAYARALPADVVGQLRAARDHHQAVHLAWARRSNVTPGKRAPAFDQSAWDAHLAEYRPAVARLDAALAVALADSAAVQLDLFAGAVA